MDLFCKGFLLKEFFVNAIHHSDSFLAGEVLLDSFPGSLCIALAEVIVGSQCIDRFSEGIYVVQGYDDSCFPIDRYPVDA